MTEGYAGTPRCDGPTGTPMVPGKRLLFQLQGNSIAVELRNCLKAIFASRGATFEFTDPSSLPHLQRGSRPSRSRRGPPIPTPRSCSCSSRTTSGAASRGTRRSTSSSRSGRRRGRTSSSCPRCPSRRGAPGKTTSDRARSRRPSTTAHWRKPTRSTSPCSTPARSSVTRRARTSGGCRASTGGEAGCDAQSGVGVRFTDGFHFCTDPDYAAHGCVGAQYQAGERRASAAVAAGIVEFYATSPAFNPAI